MAYKYTHFIPQNTASKGAKEIGVYDGTGKKILSIPLSGLSQIRGIKQYSVGIVSDVHFYSSDTTWNPSGKLDKMFSPKI